jgi:hypothetical protein
MLAATANVVVVIIIVAAVTLAIVIVPVAVIALVFVLRCPPVDLLHLLVLACCFDSVTGIAVHPSFG